MFTLWTFGDSILDCGHFNSYGVTPGGLIVRNEDGLFPEFRERDLTTLGPARLEHRARDGATVEDLHSQATGLRVEGQGAAIVTVGGNDLIAGLIDDPGPGFSTFGRVLDAFLAALPIRPVLVGNVYDPTCGDDARNFTGLPPGVARAAHHRMNQTIAQVAARHGRLVDLHAHFLTGDPSWFVRVIEPSLVGASEVRRAFLPHLLALAGDDQAVAAV